jgi:hypothetical protein
VTGSVGSLDRLGLLGVVGRVPTGEQVQGVVRGRPGLGGVGEKALAGVGTQGKGLERQLEVSDYGMVEELDAVGVDPDVVGGPSDPELLAAGGQLPDQV